MDRDEARRIAAQAAIREFNDDKDMDVLEFARRMTGAIARADYLWRGGGKKETAK